MQRNCRFTRFGFLLYVCGCVCVNTHVSNHNMPLLQYNEPTAFNLTRDTLIVKMSYVEW